MGDGEIKIDLNSRVFVANIPSDQIDREELRERFAKYGFVKDLFMKKGFAFVQFNSSHEAQSAINGESGQLIKGKKIECSFAKRKPGEERPPGGAGGDDRGAVSSNLSNSTAAILAREKGGDKYPGPPSDKYPPPPGPGAGYDDFYGRDKFRDFDPYGPFGREGRDGREFPPPPARPRDRSPLRDRERDRYDDRYRDSFDKFYREDPARRDQDRFPDDRRDPYDRPPLPRDRERDMRDPLRDPPRDPLRDPPRDPLRDQPRDPLRDPLRDNLRDPPRDQRPDPRDDPYFRDDPYRRDDPYYREFERERERERDRLGGDRDRIGGERDRLGADRDRLGVDRDRLGTDRDRLGTDRDRLGTDRDRLGTDRDRIGADRDRIGADRDRLGADRDRLPAERDRLPVLDRERERDRMSLDRDRDRDPYADSLSYRREPYRDPYSRDRGERENFERRSASSAPATSAPDYLPPLQGKPVDCEILVLNKQQRGYAESVERRIKGLGISTDMMFLNPEASIMAVLDGATRNGALYAIMVSSSHEIHRSLTLNILHGTPQEHRNMPLEDAMSLMARNYDRYIQDLREKRSQTASGTATAGKSGADGQAAAAVELTLTQLFSLLADGRQLTIAEVDRVIVFLEEMRERMAEDQGAPPRKKAPAAAAPAVQAKGKEDPNALQSRILSLIGTNASPASVASVASAITKEANAASAVQAVAKQMLMGRDRQAQAQPQPQAQAQAQAQMKAQAAKQGLLSTPSSSRTLLATPGSKTLLSTPKPAMQTSAPAAAKPQTSASSSLNLDNPTVKKALDNLIQTGPNLLRNFGNGSQTNTPQNQMGAARMSMNPNVVIHEQQIAKAQVEAIRTMQQLKQVPQNVQHNIQMAGAASLMAAGMQAGNMGHPGMTPQQMHALQAQSMAYSMRGQPPPPPMGPPPGRPMY